MAGPVLYSANPWYAHEISMKYRGGSHVVWCSEYYDPTTAPPGSAESLIAPSSSPKGIFDALRDDCHREDMRSTLIRRYRKTFRRLATDWLGLNEIDGDQYSEIIATIKSHSWKIWRPRVYVIPKDSIVAAERLVTVPHRQRASYGPELQIINLMPNEFDIVEW